MSSNIAEKDIHQQLKLIIRNKSFEPEEVNWDELREEIPKTILNIITETYHTDLKTQMKHPLNGHNVQTVEHFTQKLVKQLQTFSISPPFTILRLAEVLDDPQIYYSNAIKFLRALDSIIGVQSSISDFQHNETTNGLTKNGSEKSIDSTELYHTQKETPTIIIGTEESQTIVLSKIDWLTEDDITEIEDESYLMDEYPLEDPNVVHSNILDEDEYPLENDVNKKRKVDTENDVLDGEGDKKSEVVDSPEKRFKTDLSQSNVTNDNQNNEVELELSITKNKEEDIKQFENFKHGGGTVRPDDISQIDENQKKEDDEDEVDVGNTTLEEDKMDID